jgi:hypothetical protein
MAKVKSVAVDLDGKRASVEVDAPSAADAAALLPRWGRARAGQRGAGFWSLLPSSCRPRRGGREPRPSEALRDPRLLLPHSRPRRPRPGTRLPLPSFVQAIKDLGFEAGARPAAPGKARGALGELGGAARQIPKRQLPCAPHPHPHPAAPAAPPPPLPPPSSLHAEPLK